jgi:hypothetical protein
MAESLRKIDRLALGDPLNLEGLEPLLEQAHVELVESAIPAALLDDRSEVRMILDLLTQLETVNELVLETSYKLQKAHDRILSMEKELIVQEVLLERIRDLEAEAQKVIELETWLEAALVENLSLKRPWWKKLLRIKD